MKIDILILILILIIHIIILSPAHSVWRHIVTIILLLLHYAIRLFRCIVHLLTATCGSASSPGVSI